MFKTFKWIVQDDIGYVVLNKPPTNIMNLEFFEEFSTLTDQYFSHNYLKASIIYSEGRHFSAGADIHDLLSIGETRDIATAFYQKNSKSFQKIYSAAFPVICLIKGVCIGSAMELALSCHFRFASGKILMGFPEAGFNLMTGCGGSVFLSEITSKKNTLELLLTGKNLETNEAYELKLIDAVVSKEEIMSIAHDFAISISKNYDKKLKAFYLKKYLFKIK